MKGDFCIIMATRERFLKDETSPVASNFMLKTIKTSRKNIVWDQGYTLGKTAWSQHRPFLFEEFLNLVKKLPVGHVLHLDSGSGNGIKMVEYAKAGLNTLGVDTSKSGVREARKLIRNLGLSETCQVIEASSLHLPVRDDSASSVSDILCFTHFNGEDQEKYLKEISRVLVKGGCLLFELFSDKDKHFHGHPVSKSYYFSYDPKNPLMKDYAHYDGMYNVHFGKQDIENTFKDFEIIKMKEFSHPLYEYRRLWNVILRKP